MKSLDLTIFNDATWVVTLPNGDKIEVKKPTQKLLMVLEQKIKEVENKKNRTTQLKNLMDLTKMILGDNKGDVAIDDDVMDLLTMDMLYAIYFGYMEFANEVVTNMSFKELDNSATVS